MHTSKIPTSHKSLHGSFKEQSNARYTLPSSSASSSTNTAATLSPLISHRSTLSNSGNSSSLNNNNTNSKIANDLISKLNTQQPQSLQPSLNNTQTSLTINLKQPPSRSHSLLHHTPSTSKVSLSSSNNNTNYTTSSVIPILQPHSPHHHQHHHHSSHSHTTGNHHNSNSLNNHHGHHHHHTSSNSSSNNNSRYPDQQMSNKTKRKTIELKTNKLRIMPSPIIHISDLFKCFLKNVPKYTETIEGPALCITYDTILKDEHWDEILICNDNDDSTTNSSSSSRHSTSSKTQAQQQEKQNASKFFSFFHITDFIAILSGQQVAFVDPYERFTQDPVNSTTPGSAPNERSYIAYFDLKRDINATDEHAAQLKQLEKLFNQPSLTKTRFFNGTIIRLPLRTQHQSLQSSSLINGNSTQTSNTHITNKYVFIKDLLVNAKDFMKEAHLHILFSKNISNIQFCRTKDGQNIENIYSISVEDACIEPFKNKYKKIHESILAGEFPSSSTILVTIKKQIENKVDSVDWILSIFADTMRLLNSNYFLMKIAIPVTDNYEKDLRFSHKTNLISSDTGFIKTLQLNKPIICYIEDKEGILMSHLCRLNIIDSLKLSHFNDAFTLLLKDLTLLVRKDPTLVWSLMPNCDSYKDYEDLLKDIWTEICKHQLFYSKTEGWGYVGIEDMIINNIDETTELHNILTYIYANSNYPVVIMPPHILSSLKKYAPKDSLQIMQSIQISDILHNNQYLIEQLKFNEKILLLEYLLTELQPRLIVDLQLLQLINGKFIKFQSQAKAKEPIYLCDNLDYLKLFSDNLNIQFVNPNLPQNIMSTLKLAEFQKATQVKMISDADLTDLINLPKEWKNGDEKLLWSLKANYSKYNIEWLDNLWKYLNDTKNSLQSVENLNVIYAPTLIIDNDFLILYKLNKNSNLVYTPISTAAVNEDIDDGMITDTNPITDNIYQIIIKILQKLGFICLETLSKPILQNKILFQSYIPHIRKTRLNLLKAFRNKYKHVSQLKIQQDFNALLNETEIKHLREYISKIDIKQIIAKYTHSNQDISEYNSLIDILKNLAIFDNSSVECIDHYITLNDCSIIYESNNIRLPFELPGLKPFICVYDLDTKNLIENLLNLNIIKDFKLILYEILKYLTNKELNSLNTYKIHCLGKWLLQNSLNYIKIDAYLYELLRQTKLFMNQKQELCSLQQFIHIPQTIREQKYINLIDLKYLPAKDLFLNDDLLINEYKLRNIQQLRIDEIIDLFEYTIKQTSEQLRRLFAELIIDILLYHLNLNSIEKYLNEYSNIKACTLKHFLMNVDWIPIQLTRPQSYPQSLLWKDSDIGKDAAVNVKNRVKYCSPRDSLNQQYAYCAGSVTYISDLVVPNELKLNIDLKQINLDIIVRHLKNTKKYFDQYALKSEWYDYLTIAKNCYEHMNLYDTQDIYRELKSNDLTDWLWNGSGFSSISQIFLITDRDHPLCTHVHTIPYELYVYLKFFERIGIKKLPDIKQLEEILIKIFKLTKQQPNEILEYAAKNYPLINWVKSNYTDKKLLNIIKEYEENLISTSTAHNQSVPFVQQQQQQQHANDDSFHLYLPELYRSNDIKDHIVTSVKLILKTSKQVVILDEDGYLQRKIHSQTQQQLQIYDHYRVYNELLLPNLNSLNKLVKDAIVLFALDHADTKMLEILRDHACVPVQPAGRTLRKPNKLVHPTGKIAALYSDTDACFPCGTEDTYLRNDRLQILKILGMKCDSISWKELSERAESVTKIREYDAALERSIAVLNFLNDMLQQTSTTSEEHDKQEVSQQLRQIKFLPVKYKPYKFNLYWFGDKYKFHFAKPNELLSSQYEYLCSTKYPIPLQEYKCKENLITKQIEQYLGLDDFDQKFKLKDALDQLEYVAKINFKEINDSKDLKIINDMCHQIYEYIQQECRKNEQLVSDFFHKTNCILVDDEFINVQQLCTQLNVNLKPYFYQIPSNLLRSYGYLFEKCLKIKTKPDLSDLLSVIDQIRKKYNLTRVSLKDDFNMLINVYTVIIDQGYQCITNLYLPNCNSVLVPGRLLYMFPASSIETEIVPNSDEYVHPDIDRRVCKIAGAMNSNKKQSISPLTIPPPTTVSPPPATPSQVPLIFSNSVASSYTTPVTTPTNGSHSILRIFPRVFGNKRLENILSRLDDEHIDVKYINLMDEGNPQIVLDYLLEVNRLHSNQLSTYLSEEDIFTILKYFNDFHARNYPNIQAITQRLKELKIYKPLWYDNYISLASQPAHNCYLISDEIAVLLRRAFKQNPLQALLIIKRNELTNLYKCLNFTFTSEFESYIALCVPLMRKLDTKLQFNFLKYFYDDILDKTYMHEKEKCYKTLRDSLHINTKSTQCKLISEMYDFKNESLRLLLDDSYFPDSDYFDTPQCLKFLKDCGLRTFIHPDLLKQLMTEIETTVQKNSEWSNELRKRSQIIYEHIVDNWERYDSKILDIRFLEPYLPDESIRNLCTPFEYDQFRQTCLKLSDAELSKYEYLVWSSSFILPKFIQTDTLDKNTSAFFKLNRKPCYSIINQHLMNLCSTVNTSNKNGIDEDLLVNVLKVCYDYLNDLNDASNKDTYKQFEDKEIIWSNSTKRFVKPTQICCDLDVQDEIPPFLYSLTNKLTDYKQLFIRLGAKEKPYPMLYGDILRKMAKVCGDDYLNSNELCKALKAMECFFKYLTKSLTQPSTVQDEQVNPQHKLAGLYFLTTELKLQKSNQIVIIDDRASLEYVQKLSEDKFLFNPSEKILKMQTAQIKQLTDKIFVSQRPTLFTQKYEETFDYTLPEDPESQRQILLTTLERKYEQLFTSKQLHNCLARCISHYGACESEHLFVEKLEKVIGERLSCVKVVCVEELSTYLCYRRLTTQQKLDQTREDKVCYLTSEASSTGVQYTTIYLNKRHIDQPYFYLCLTRALKPLFIDLKIDYSVLSSFLASGISNFAKILQFINVGTEENILNVLKLQYIPNSGKLYGDDVSLLAKFDAKVHNILPGDLCVYCVDDSGAYIYCEVNKIDLKLVNNRVKYVFNVYTDATCKNTMIIEEDNFFVLENWHRINDALNSKPPDERESAFKSSSTANGGANGGANASSASSETGRRTPENEYYNSSSDYETKSEPSSLYGSNENLDKAASQEEIEKAINEINDQIREIFAKFDDAGDRRRAMNKLIVKWHPDKNRHNGLVNLATEVFKYLNNKREKIESMNFQTSYTDSGYFRYSPYTSGTTYSPYGSSYSRTTSSPTGGASTNNDDYKSSRHYGSFEDLHRKYSNGSATGGTTNGANGTGSSENFTSDSTYTGSASGTGPNLGRSGSFRQDWERRRQQKRQNTTGDRSSPGARRRGTDFSNMDIGLWFSQAKLDLESAENDMHPVSGKPAYEWVCYKCYRTIEKALRALHYFKGNGNLHTHAADIHTLLIGVETSIREIATRFLSYISKEANAMQYPGIARFGKIPNEVFPITKAEQAIEYAKKILQLVDDIIYAN